MVYYTDNSITKGLESHSVAAGISGQFNVLLDKQSQEVSDLTRQIEDHTPDIYLGNSTTLAAEGSQVFIISTENSAGCSAENKNSTQVRTVQLIDKSQSSKVL